MIEATKSSFAYKSSSIHLHCHSAYTLQLHFKVSEMFGGLDICSLEAVVAKDGREVSLIITTTTIPILLIIINHLCISSCLICQYFFQVIIEVNDCALSLMGESQEEDRRHLAEMVLAKMEERCGLGEEHTNGVAEPVEAEEEAAGEKVAESMGGGSTVPPGPVAAGRRVGRAKLPPGPIQRGPPDRTRQPSQGTTCSLSTPWNSIVLCKMFNYVLLTNLTALHLSNHIA